MLGTRAGAGEEQRRRQEEQEEEVEVDVEVEVGVGAGAGAVAELLRGDCHQPAPVYSPHGSVPFFLGDHLAGGGDGGDDNGCLL